VDQGKQCKAVVCLHSAPVRAAGVAENEGLSWGRLGKQGASRSGELLASKLASSIVGAGDEAASGIVDVDVDVGPVLEALLGAAIGELVSQLVGVDTHVSWDPVNDDGDREAADLELERLGQAWMCE
jgi:hypothetical protein